MNKKIEESTSLPIIGWREWVGLPDFGVKRIKVKVDTGARSSSLHAFDLKMFKKGGEDWVSFSIHPKQKHDGIQVRAESKVLEFRSVRSSSGNAEMRPVVIANVALLGTKWPIELTLANRDKMSFRMLLGREAFRRRFVVDAGRSYYGGRPKRKKGRKRE